MRISVLFVLCLWLATACSSHKNSFTSPDFGLKLKTLSVRVGDVGVLAGKGIPTTLGNVRVLIGGKEVSVVSQSSTQVRFMIPQGAQGELTVEIGDKITDFPDFSIHTSVIYALGKDNRTNSANAYRLDAGLEPLLIAGVRENSSLLYDLAWTSGLLAVATEFTKDGNVFHFQRVNLETGEVDSISTSRLGSLFPDFIPDPAGQRLIGFNATSPQVSGLFVEVDPGQGKIVSSITSILNVTSFNYGVMAPSGYLYGFGNMDNSTQTSSLLKLNLNTSSVSGYTFQNEYSGLAINPFINVVYTLDITNRQLVVIDLEDGSVTKSIDFPSTVFPHQLAFIPETGQVWVLANEFNGGIKNYIYQINPETGVSNPVELTQRVSLINLVLR